MGAVNTREQRLESLLMRWLVLPYIKGEQRLLTEAEIAERDILRIEVIKELNRSE